MALRNIPTSKDIYIEVDGKRIAIVQSYKAQTAKTSKSIESFGSELPVAVVSGKLSHTLELKKVIPLLSAQIEVVDFYDLSNFNVMIVKPDYTIAYRECEWSEISESMNLNEPCIEQVKIIARKRMIIK